MAGGVLVPDIMRHVSLRYGCHVHDNTAGPAYLILSVVDDRLALHIHTSDLKAECGRLHQALPLEGSLELRSRPFQSIILWWGDKGQAEESGKGGGTAGPGVEGNISGNIWKIWPMHSMAVLPMPRAGLQATPHSSAHAVRPSWLGR